MGRRKIAIQPITDERNRTVTFVKRKAGLFKKAHELAILCQVDLAVIIVGHNHKVYEFSSDNTQELLKKYNTASKIQEQKSPGDYGDYVKKSRISRDPNGRRGNVNKVVSHASTPEFDDEDFDVSESEEGGDEEDDDDEEEGHKLDSRNRKRVATGRQLTIEEEDENEAKLENVEGDLNGTDMDEVQNPKRRRIISRRMEDLKRTNSQTPSKRPSSNRLKKSQSARSSQSSSKSMTPKQNDSLSLSKDQHNYQQQQQAQQAQAQALRQHQGTGLGLGPGPGPAGVMYGAPQDQSRIQTTFEQHRASLMKQQAYPSTLPPFSTFPVHHNGTAGTAVVPNSGSSTANISSQLHQTQYVGSRNDSTNMGGNASSYPYVSSPAYSVNSSASGNNISGNTALHRPILRVQIPSSNSEASPNNGKSTLNDNENNNNNNDNNNNNNNNNNNKINNGDANNQNSHQNQSNNSNANTKGNDENNHNLNVEKSDSAVTMTAESKNENDANFSNKNLHNESIGNGGGDAGGRGTSSRAHKPILPGLSITANTPHPQEGGNSNSSKSTPISANGPNGYFVLPQPSPSGTHNVTNSNLFPSPFIPNAPNNNGGSNSVITNNGNNPVNSSGFRPPFHNINNGALFNGETPLSALPSKYLNTDYLFPSPSNFYTNEWNIPFGTGNTPIGGGPSNLRSSGLTSSMVNSNNIGTGTANNNENSNNASTGSGGGVGGMLSAIANSSGMMLPSPSQMMSGVFGNSFGAGSAIISTNKKGTEENTNGGSRIKNDHKD